MRRYLASLSFTLTFVASLIGGVTAAQAVVVGMGVSGRAGVALAPTTGLPSSIHPVTGGAPCSDPFLALDLRRPNVLDNGLCWQGGQATNNVMHGAETFALTWDPNRADWATTRDYVEQYLRDVADSSGTFTSPYAVTSQYNDFGGRAGGLSPSRLYGGGCIDYGSPGGATCRFPNAVGTGDGRNYPVSAATGSDCIPTGVSYNPIVASTQGVPVGWQRNTVCLTDRRIQDELTAMVGEMGLNGRIQQPHTPQLVLLTPPGVETCLDASGTLCSARAPSADPKQAAGQFCSYHSWIKVGDQVYSYVVQPWSAYTKCDDPNILPPGSPVSAHDLATDVGRRLVSPLSQGQIASIVDPWLNGWFGTGGSEINDNGCGPYVPGDKATVGNSSQNPYYLQPEFNNAGVLESDPNAPACASGVALAPTFVVPSPIDQGNVVAFDGSVTVSTLMVSKNNYQWNFGDGTTGVGPSVVHTYTRGGTYSVTLSVTDRGGNHTSISQTIEVLGADGKPVPPPTPSSPGLHARLQLMPQGLRTMLRSGLAARVSSNEVADGIATMSISARDAARAHIRHGRAATAVIARGTVSQIRTGTVALNLHLSPATAAKLRRLSHVTLTLRISLVAADHNRLTIVAAGRY
jgi:hypothetical protein